MLANKWIIRNLVYVPKISTRPGSITRSIAFRYFLSSLEASNYESSILPMISKHNAALKPYVVPRKSRTLVGRDSSGSSEAAARVQFVEFISRRSNDHLNNRRNSSLYVFLQFCTELHPKYRLVQLDSTPEIDFNFCLTYISFHCPLCTGSSERKVAKLRESSAWLRLAHA